MFPLTRVPFWYRFFEPQPNAYEVNFENAGRKAIALDLERLGFHLPRADADPIYKWTAPTLDTLRTKN